MRTEELEALLKQLALRKPDPALRERVLAAMGPAGVKPQVSFWRQWRWSLAAMAITIGLAFLNIVVDTAREQRLVAYTGTPPRGVAYNVRADLKQLRLVQRMAIAESWLDQPGGTTPRRREIP